MSLIELDDTPIAKIMFLSLCHQMDIMDLDQIKEKYKTMISKSKKIDWLLENLQKEGIKTELKFETYDKYRRPIAIFRKPENYLLLYEYFRDKKIVSNLRKNNKLGLHVILSKGSIVCNDKTRLAMYKYEGKFLFKGKY